MNHQVCMTCRRPSKAWRHQQPGSVATLWHTMQAAPASMPCWTPLNDTTVVGLLEMPCRSHESSMQTSVYVGVRWMSSRELACLLADRLCATASMSAAGPGWCHHLCTTPRCCLQQAFARCWQAHPHPPHPPPTPPCTILPHVTSPHTIYPPPPTSHTSHTTHYAAPGPAPPSDPSSPLSLSLILLRISVLLMSLRNSLSASPMNRSFSSGGTLA